MSDTEAEPTLTLTSKGRGDTMAVERGAIKFENTTIEYTVTRSRRRKNTVGISLDHGEGVLVVAPIRIPKEEIRELVLRRARWIVQKTAELAARPGPRDFVSGESLLYLGCEAPLLVEHTGPETTAGGDGFIPRARMPQGGRASPETIAEHEGFGTRVRRVAIRFERGRFAVAVPARLAGEERRYAIEAALMSWYKARAAEHLAERVAHWSKVANLTPSRVLIRNQRRRWGSCSRDGSLRFNWRIMMAPPAVVDYLVVHELAHLRVRDHSKKFWAEMARLMPDYQARRSALREMEARLCF